MPLIKEKIEVTAQLLLALYYAKNKCILMADADWFHNYIMQQEKTCSPLMAIQKLIVSLRNKVTVVRFKTCCAI